MRDLGAVQFPVLFALVAELIDLFGDFELTDLFADFEFIDQFDDHDREISYKHNAWF